MRIGNLELIVMSTLKGSNPLFERAQFPPRSVKVIVREPIRYSSCFLARIPIQVESPNCVRIGKRGASRVTST